MSLAAPSRFQEREFLSELEAAGFHGITIEKWESEPFAVVSVHTLSKRAP